MPCFLMLKRFLKIRFLPFFFLGLLFFASSLFFANCPETLQAMQTAQKNQTAQVAQVIQTVQTVKEENNSVQAAIPTNIHQYKNVWTKAPERIPTTYSPDAPLLGNGDFLTTFGYSQNKLTFYLDKNDFWRLQSQADDLCGPRIVSLLEISGTELENLTFSAEQQLFDGKTEIQLNAGDKTVAVNAWIAATENILVLQIQSNKNIELNIRLNQASDPRAEFQFGETDNVAWIDCSYKKDVDIPTEAAVGLKRLDSPLSKTLSFQANQPMTLVLAVESLFQSENPLQNVIKRCQKYQSEDDIRHLNEQSQAWWTQYWKKSSVQLDEPVLMKGYYQGLYTMGACSRDKRFPPGLFGWVSDNHPSWNGDYHLNYNFSAPFYGLYSSNRLEQAEPENAPLIDFIERGKWYAKNAVQCRGILYPVGIGPLGIESTRDFPMYMQTPNFEKGGLFFQQRSNAAYCLVNMAQHWRCTYDKDYGKKIYPYVLSVVEFWEDYLKFEDGRYIIYGDAIHEGSGQDKNPILTLGLLRNTIDLILDLSSELQIDLNRQEKWKDILEHLSDFPTQIREGQKVFRYTEEGMAWCGGNGLGIQHIYPGNAISLSSDPELVQTAQNMIGQMRRWSDSNTTSSFYVAAIRVGFNPQEVWNELKNYAQRTYPNGFQKNNPHGIENSLVVANAINEMLCMSVDHKIRLFHGLPEKENASFAQLRTWDAFLVSAAKKNGIVSEVKIFSEQGRNCTLVNPWMKSAVLLQRNGKDAEVLPDGEILSFPTSVGEMIVLIPQN